MIIRLIFLSFLLSFLLHICNCTEESAPLTQDGDELDVRHPSMFKIGDEWLSLPEVYSNLDFSADNTPASDEDVDGQLRSVSSGKLLSVKQLNYYKENFVNLVRH